MVTGTRAGADRSAGRPVVGVLALQGSFPLHIRSLERSGVAAREVRRPADLEGLSGLIVPGGESTTMEKLAKRNGLFEAIRERGREGLPLFGTCAGAILIGKGRERPERWELADVELLRNAYGTQLESFSAELDLAPFERPFHGVFIRAPKMRVEEGARGVEVLGTAGGEPVLARSGNVLLATFHPELTDDLRLHRYFLELAEATP